MSANTFVDNAKVMAKGQITIPKDVRDVLGVSSGDRVTFIVEGNTVRIVNSAVYAMQMLQQEMTGEAERTGLTSEDNIMALIKVTGRAFHIYETWCIAKALREVKLPTPKKSNAVGIAHTAYSMPLFICSTDKSETACT